MTRADSIGSIGTDDLEHIESLLGRYLQETGARCAVLIDRTGRLLAAAGNTGTLDQTAFASLAAADFAASDQLAALLGEREFAALYHHGERQSMYLADIDGWAIVAAMFDRRTTLGMVRIKTKGVVARLGRVFRGIVESGPSGSVVSMEVGWADDAESEIDRLFTD
jgi:predicted regulator of Ras-like GTPase activity (Roadblock/LC7/MglB family)